MFAAVLAVNRTGLPLGWSIVLSALGLTLWSGAGVPGLVFQASQFVAAENVLLLVVVLCLLYFTEALGASGRIERTIGALRALLRRPSLLLAGLPALIGLLPMPGGALVSAPLVARVDPENRLTPEHKVALNYWFRHIWEYWWPLYPGVVLALRYSGLPAPLFFGLQMPLTAAALAGGALFVLRKVPRWEAPAGTAGRLSGRDAGAALVPMGVLVLVSVVGAPLLPMAGVSRTLANLAAMLAGLVVALAMVCAAGPRALVQASGMLRSARTWGMLLVVAGVQMFAAALKCPLTQSGETLVTRMAAEFLAAGIPVVAVMVIVPAVAGFVTGIAVGFVGVSFPLVFGLLGDAPTTAQLAATTMLAYASGYTGMMLSPIHICFVVTSEYFKLPSILPAYRYLTGAAAVVFVCALLLSGLYLVAL